jgi:hypothetical protein
MVAYTTTYSFAKPTVGDDEDVWGGYLNGNFDSIEALLNGTTALTSLSLTGDITFGDNDKAIFGAGSDLRVYHDGTNSIFGITNTHTGKISNITDNEDFITFTPNNAVTIFHDNSPKLTTTSTGVDITGNIAVSGTVDGRDVSADGAKLDGIEAGATADQTAAEIKTAYESNANTNAFTDAEQTKLAGIEAGATADQTASEILTLLKTVDGAGSGLDADTLDGISSGSFLRSDVADSTDSTITFNTLFNEPMIRHGSSGPLIRSDGNYLVLDGVSGGGLLYLNNFGNITADGNTVWHAGNDGSGSGLDADLWDGNQFSSYLNQAVLTTSSPSFAGLNINGNLNAVDNIYLAGSLYHEGDTDTRLLFDTNTITLQTGGSSEITINTSGVRLGDTGNGYFQPVSGNYGSVQIDGGAHTGWEGYSIGGRAVFMHDNASRMGLYDDVNNEWGIYCDFNGTTVLHHNGASKLDTLSNGVSINGNLYTDGSNAEDWDSLSGTSVTCNVDNAGAFSLTMTGNTTFTFSGADNNWSQGFILQLTGNGSTVTWPSSVDWAGGTAPDAPASGETDIYVFWTRDGGTTWYGVQSIDAAA